MLDRGLLAYDALVARERRIPAPIAFGVNVVPESRRRRTSRPPATRPTRCARSRPASGTPRAAEPPALYSFDPDTGRLAVTTPTYNTAIVAVNQRAFPYGGLDLARLYDGDQEVAANIGGTGAAAFGLTARARRPRAAHPVRHPRVHGRWRAAAAVRAPRGVGASASSVGPRAYAGPFTDLRVRGTVRSDGMAATSALPLHAGLDRGALDAARAARPREPR